MALKNLFDMVKADRYTADGREAIIKAQEEETEDQVYNIGDISRKTGLMKTANGWVKPPKGKQPGAKKENPTRTFEFKAGPDGNPVAGSGKEVKTYKTKKEAEAALKKQNAAPANKTTIRQGPNTKTLNETPAEHVQKNLDAYKGYSPYDMEELVLKPSGYTEIKKLKTARGAQTITYSKEGAEDITLHFDKDGELINADVAGSKPAAASDIPDFKGMASEDYDKKLRSEGWTTGGWEGSGTHASAIFKKGDRTIRVNEGQPGKITSVQEISKPSESKPTADFTKYKRDTGLDLYGKSAQEGEQYMKENGFELQPESRPDRKIYKNGFGEIYEADYTPEGVFNGGSHSNAPIPGRDNHRAYQEGMGNKYLGQKKREDGTVTQVYLTPEGKYESSDFTAKGEYNGGSTSSEEFYKKWYNYDLDDAAPRVLTGDCKIRIKRETKDGTYTPESINAPREKLEKKLTGDCKVRVRKA